MSLREVYSLAHTAECRLQMAAGRSNRDLRFVVGHLMHYESLRLRIVEIEHDIGKGHRAKAVQSRRTGHVEGQPLRHKPSNGHLGTRSPPSSAISDDGGNDGGHDDSDDSEGVEDVDGEDDSLGLRRFSASGPKPPALYDDDLDEADDEDDDLVSPEESDQATLERTLKSPADDKLTNAYDGVRKCPCHGHTDAPAFEQMWELPHEQGDKDGVTRAIAQVAA